VRVDEGSRSNLGRWAVRLPFAALATSLVLLRLQVLGDLDLGLGEALRGGLAAGVAGDVMAALVVELLAELSAAAFARRSAIVWMAAAALIWFITVANAVYFRFFHMPLDWWLVELHWRDVVEVKHSATSLATSGWLFVSGLCLVLALFSTGWNAQRASRRGSLVAGARLRHLLVAAGLGLLIALLWEAPALQSVNDGTPVLKDHILRSWLQQNFRAGMYQRVGIGWTDDLAAAPDNVDLRTPTVPLAWYRDFGAPRAIVTEDAKWPLVRTLAPTPAEVRSARESLGLPEAGAIHVIVIFVESLRAWEYLEPEIGPLTFPGLRRVLADHALVFSQAYSSSRTPGQTVRGYFSTLCSMLPNTLGPSVYLANTTLRVRCLQEVLRQAGYATLHVNAYRATFHQTRLFESLHGTELFFDRPYFEGLGLSPLPDRWEIPDASFLEAARSLLEAQAAAGKPLFAALSTLGTHHPYLPAPATPRAASLPRLQGAGDDYLGFVARLEAADQALSSFFGAFFAGPLGDNTLVVLMGDHSTPLLPPGQRSPFETEELESRIFLALVTKHPAEPGVRRHLVHQVDIAPTVAAVTGSRGPVAWMGRNVLAGDGSPYLYEDRSRLSFRTTEMSCLSANDAPLTCWNTRDRDPLFDADLPEVTPRPDEVAGFRAVLKANLWSIILNQVFPP
jgi:phosphoglycerol transferase MdoB-like AlkP superfamily enzyme